MEKLKAVLVKPLRKAEVVELEIENLEKIIGGQILTQFNDDCTLAIVQREFAEYFGEPFCRANVAEDGRIVELFSGTLVVLGVGEQGLCSLSEEQTALVLEEFGCPQVLARDFDTLKVMDFKED